MVTKLNEIKKLSPEERIEKLKKIEEENKKEINEAEKIIKDSIREINVKEKIRDLPIPQIKAVDIESLFSPEEKEVFAVKRYKDLVVRHAEEEKAEIPLEETVKQEEPRATKEELAAHIKYQVLANELRREPTENVVQELENIYHQVIEGTGVTGDQMTMAYAANVVARERQQEIERGTYGRLDEQVSNQLDIARQIFKSIQDKYKLR
ncbi:hypothetical protein COY26_00630 [Candidatus Woesearchaeota archaeon CG_4_10_14_0_2_um_filter_33_10]|nr:MAG: hypothetical protein AUJ83_01605 [Candidatus Woesearchaeota archaeon CG1_02_33_12]PIN78548.1 MAG: hypothetical protein COV14_03310 [Candidatus Woesearchaeota archaeon CG10_big_fil_rev_8_21_14_0_10_33_12]PIU72330.1 MAG: hypothetical protein COS79_03505 [Candidatus Woesearchaeota archaeon CG06_land_8_20_14_3_00_33_13]PIZ53880.1 MAG: hypothetical protein COY26_00630 [Candidatus Woesearchaeota archaeon CG_4_10_14_0_2_um_filter_33_10]